MRSGMVAGRGWLRACPRRGKRLAPGVACLAALVAVVGLTGGAAQAADAPPAHLAPMRSIPNWSGYVATHRSAKHVSYKSVTATWTVPAATCAKGQGATSSSVWVGIGGYTTTNQEEVGTNSNCDKHDSPVYFAWFELVPYLSYQTFPNINHKVHAGDTITGLVRILNTRFVRLDVRDLTQGWIFARTINFTSQDTTTADWITESPATCVLYTCQEASLTNFGSVTMRNISAVGNGATGTLTDPKWKVIPIRLVPTKLTVPDINPTATATDHNGKQGQAKSPAGATPGKYSTDGTSFSIKWIPIARQPV
jgi:hypothetical protein